MSEGIEVPHFEFEVDDVLYEDGDKFGKVEQRYYSEDCIIKESGWYYKIRAYELDEIHISIDEAHRMYSTTEGDQE